MARITGEITIDRPVATVFDFVADERNEPKYNPEMVRSELVAGEPIGVGTRFAAVHTGRRGPFGMTIDLTEYHRPRRLGRRPRRRPGRSAVR